MIARRTLLSALPVAAIVFPGAAVRAHGPAHPPARAAAALREQKPWGIAGDAATVRRTIPIAMDDRMRFTPDHITVREGETVRLRVHNRGKVLHELVIGTPDELAAHAELMKKYPGMEHDEPYMAHVDPARRADIIWTFNRPGSFQFACLLPGHFEAGMVGRITVIPQ